MPHRNFAAALLLSSVATAICAPACAAVVEATANGFQIRHEVGVNAAPAAVYAVLTKQIGSWWNSAHSFSGDAKNMSIDARPGGCFCEQLPDGGGVEHMRVIFVAPGKTIRMAGSLGPLQASGVSGSLTWKMTAAAAGTTLEVTYSIGGYILNGLDKMAPAVDQVIAEQVQRLKRFIETGKPE